MQNCCTNNSLLSHDKTIFSLLELLNHVLPISEYVLENNNSFLFWWKTYTKRCRNNYAISRAKILSPVAHCVWSSVFNFRIWFGKRKKVMKVNILNQKYVKNSEPPLPFFENWEKKTLILGKTTLIVSIFRLNLPFRM